MFWAQLILTLIALLLCSFSPGFLLVRRLPWRPLEKLCGAIAASLILLYLIAFGVFCFAPSAETGIFRGVACLAAVLAILEWREIRRLAKSFGARQALQGFGFLLLWTLAALCMIRNYSGAGWLGDWLEHFQRALIFLHHLPKNIAIIDDYQFPARPPLMNLLDAFFMAQAADRFEMHQIVFTFFNLLFFLPCCLLMRALVKSRKARYLPLAALFALTPAFVENATYTWTKLLAAFFVLFAIWLYLAGLRKNDSVRIVAAFVTIAAGLLVHYSAGPYIVFLAGHYLIFEFRKRPRKIRELAAIALCCGLLLATWFGYSVQAYGWHSTVASNSSVIDAQHYQGNAVKRIAGNMFATLVPALLRGPDALRMLDQPNAWANLRDQFFVIFQTNFIFALGLVGGPYVIWLLYRTFRARAAGRERFFWALFIPANLLMGIAVVGEADQMGLTHLTLLPLVALGIAFLAASFPWNRGMAALLIAGCAAGFLLGIFLQLQIENLDNSPGRTVFARAHLRNYLFQMEDPTPDTLNRYAWGNWLLKNYERIYLEGIRELQTAPDARIRTIVDGMRVDIGRNSYNFGGWYGRHGGRVTFLGDDLAGPSFAGLGIPAIAMLLLFAALVHALWRESMALAPRRAAAPTPARTGPPVLKKAAKRR